MDQHEHSKLFSEFPPVSTQTWEDRIVGDLKGADYARKLIWKTEEGFDVRPYYRAEDLEGIEYLDTLPDTFPYVRGNRTSNNEWAIRQDIVDEDIETVNRKAREAISRGATSIGLKSTQVNTHKQMGQLLEGIDPGKTEINFIASPSYPLTLELFIYEVLNRGGRSVNVKGSLNFDPVSYLLVHGDFYSDWMQNLEETEYLLQTAQTKLPEFKVITINGHYFQDAGSTLVQELAFSLASANEYLAGITDKGLTVDQVAPFIQFSFATGPDYFLEIAKLRAARLLWARMVAEYQPASEQSSRMFIHASTALWNKSIYDPYVNMLRTTTEGMSAVLGNADSVTLLPFDGSCQAPDEFSSRVSRNQQLVLREESYLDKIIDPAAGSYYIENLTHAIATHAWDLFREVEGRGGMLQCIKAGYIQDEITKSRQKKETDIAQRRIIMLGTNQFPNLQENVTDHIQIPITSRSNTPGTYKKLEPFRAGAPFEAIRFATERFVKSGHKRPAVFLFTMGNLAMLRARAGFAANFFGCAGYEIIDNPGFSTVAEGVEAAHLSDAEIIVICSSDDEYPVIVPEIITQIKARNMKTRQVVAGFPKEVIEQLKQAGTDDFIHVKSDLLGTLTAYNRHLGIE